MKYHGREETIFIPEGVTRIAREAFGSNKEVVRVILPASLQIIESYAFDNCSNLEEVLAQESLVKVEKC